jgi:CxxC-x17-CxxC domain-containing protein
MEFQDRQLTCVECGGEFLWTAGEQLFYADKHFTHEPKRCRACKAQRVGGRAGGSSGEPARGRVETTATCSVCGKETTLPFRPTQGRPVYCRDCFRQRRTP